VPKKLSLITQNEASSSYIRHVARQRTIQKVNLLVKEKSHMTTASRLENRSSSK